MKSNFKFLLMLMFLSSFNGVVRTEASTTPVLITFHEHADWISRIRKMLEEEYSLPAELITHEWQEDPCRPRPKAILQICISDDQKLEIPVKRQDIISRSFRIFQKED